MKIQIATHALKTTPRLKEYIGQRLGLALGRYADRIGDVAVTFVVEKAGGKTKPTRCRIDVSLRKTITVEAADGDYFAAVDRAVESAVRRLALAIEVDDATLDSLK